MPHKTSCDTIYGTKLTSEWWIMGHSESQITTFSTICVVLLRTVRLERGIHQAQIADSIGKTPSAWTKIETGKNPLSFEVFIRVCNAMQVAPSAVMAAAERYALLLTQNSGSPEGWSVLSMDVPPDEDNLLMACQAYWESPGFRNQPTNRWFDSVLNGPIYNMDGTISISSVFHFVLDPEFRQQQLDFVPAVSPGLQYPRSPAI